ncbi:hypothetical protein ACFGVS_03395 [Mucilaginibacter sp. AW1-7]|uniref:hypothetical protein n=1 Tax=Mucilaginibacter sp. AW1-7 TaxID=3349874 RepID=UPI003F73882E
MAYQVLTADSGTVIADTDSDLWVQVNELNEVTITKNTAYCLATLYKVNGGFIPEKVYIFQSRKVDLVTLKNVADFFFMTLLETDLYVKEVPQDSALFPQEAARIYGTVILAA